MIPEKVLKAIDYPIPRHAMRPGYMLGGLALSFFIMLFISGVLLALFGYEPTTLKAHEGMLNITASPALSFLRSLHYLSSDAFLVLIILHVTRVVLSKSYYGERRKTWNVGLAVLGLTVGFSFTGTVLKWDQEGYEAFAHLLWANSTVPFGDSLNSLLFSGDPVWTMFNIHVIVLTALFFCVAALHLKLVKTLKISPLNPSLENADEGATFLGHMRLLFVYSVVIVGAVIVAAAFVNPPLLDAPIEGVEWTKPAWAFLFLYTLENYFGVAALLLVPPVMFGLLLAIPSFSNRENRFDAGQAIYFIGLAVLVLLILAGAWSEPVKHMM